MLSRIRKYVSVQLNQTTRAEIDARLTAFGDLVDTKIAKAISERLYKPAAPRSNSLHSTPFMQYSTCSATDMLHPRYRDLCNSLHSPPKLHRKLWEWVFVLHHLENAGVIRESMRGIGFGVGQESLPALFAGRGVSILATDAPPQIGTVQGWTETGQHSDSRELLRQPWMCSNEDFDRLVEFRHCDMSDIDVRLSGFDFTWWSCCFEHLGSLEAGTQFVINSVERCLKPGGIAVHTTELNLSSDDETIESGPTVLYRRRDILDLIETLRSRGHFPQSFVQAPDSHVLDYHVDVPPYMNDPHIKLLLGSHVTTSVGIVVQRGR